MLTRIGYYADKLLEMGWLGAAVAAPLFFNVYSSRVFEPDKIALLRSIVLIMTVLWIVKLVEGGVRGARAASQSNAATRTSKATAALQGAAQSGLPSWLGWLRVPMVVPILVYALVYIFSSAFTLTPEATWLGSYQRLQGTYTQLSYMMLGIIVIFNMRSRKQVERLVSFIILTSIPVTLYGLLQANRLDPLPWAGDTATRVASSMGNAIFVAAWLIMAVPFAIYRLLNGVSDMVTARNAEYEEEIEGDDKRRAPRRAAYMGPDYGWAVIANVVGVLMISMFVFMNSLKMVAGLPFPDAALWWAVPFALIVFYTSCWLIEWLGDGRYNPLQRTYLLIIGALLFITGLFAFVVDWEINTATITAQMKFDGSGLFWILFFILSWGAVAGLAYAFGGTYEESLTRRIGLVPVFISVIYDIIFVLGQDSSLRGFLWSLFFVFAWGSLAALAYFFGGQSEDNPDPRQGIVALALSTAYTIVIGVQLLTIYLTQSRGPWLGIGMGILVFAVAMFFVGRSRDVRWMTRAGGWVSGIALAIAIPIIALNIFVNAFNTTLPPAVVDIPIVGRAIERLSSLTRTEDGTGKVRTLIWQGATDLIVSDPLRAIIGYGPEAMYVAYNKFYPAELAHWELRNATPDRSHNVEFDHMVTMGVFGLVTYYFVVAAFYWYGIRIIRRARNKRDQLFSIALISAMTAHFIEIQTGIQIASTWTYFYLIIGTMAAFGYYVTRYLREEGAATEPAYAENAYTSAPAAEAQQPALAVAGSGQSRKAVASGAGNGKSGTATTIVASTAKKGAAPPQQQRKPGSSTGNSQQSADARRRQAAQTRLQMDTGGSDWSRHPAFLIIYAVLLVGALLVIWTINVATVRADTYFKQAQSYDGAGRYLCNDGNCSIPKYDQAINLQPNQDYYYLFRGRAYLEFAKTIEQQLDPNTPQQEIDQRRIQFLTIAQESLTRAQELNPLNTDHYANLGRLYLYWSDTNAGGGKDPSKTGLAVKNMELATQYSPGNAQLWDELAVAYSRDGQFDKAISTLLHSQTVDSTYARTPFIRGQLLQERAVAVKSALQAGAPLPTGGETDYVTLLLAAGQAFSESITLDPAFFVDNGMQGRVDYILVATQPFTDARSGSLVDTSRARNVLTDTIAKAYEQLAPIREKDFADYLRAHGGYNGSENVVPVETLESLWASNDWAGIRPTGSTRQWLNNDVLNLAHRAVVPYAALGYIKFKLYNPEDTLLTPERQRLLEEATEFYKRGVTIDPSNYFNQKNLGSLYVEQGQHLAANKQCAESQQAYDEGLKHLQAGLEIVQADPEASTNPEKSQNLEQIKGDVERTQLLKQQPCP